MELNMVEIARQLIRYVIYTLTEKKVKRLNCKIEKLEQRLKDLEDSENG